MTHEETNALRERAKELECMYAVDEVLQNKRLSLPEAMQRLIEIIPIGFSQPSACHICIELGDKRFSDPAFDEGASLCTASIISMNDEPAGRVVACYARVQDAEPPAFLQGEQRMLGAIAWRISRLAQDTKQQVSLLFDLLNRIDPEMLKRVFDKFRIQLRAHLGNGAERALCDMGLEGEPLYGEVNTLSARDVPPNPPQLTEKLIEAVAGYMSISEVYSLFNDWIQQERMLSLVKTVDNKDASIEKIVDAVRKYTMAVEKRGEAASELETWLLAELCHRFLTDDENLINLVLDNLMISDFEPMMEKIIGAGHSFGRIGGKGTGIFLAKQILRHAAQTDPMLRDIKTPRTWYIAADQIVDFLHYNDLEELNAYKYNTAFYLRMTYAGVVSKIKSGHLPPHVMQMLRVALEDLGDTPLIVRSSSLLEDRANTAFSGKYKSIFLANQGTRRQRLDELEAAVLEVYASMYNPDSIEYRRTRNLLNFTEQMGVLIQEVVGVRMGPYYAPLYAGVAFSRNLLRWSPRITLEGGLARVVMGLGTRAVDRLKDDYPVMFSPGQPNFRINQNPQDVARYAPRQIDLINLEKGCFETVDITGFLRRYGREVPDLHKLVSVLEEDFLRSTNAFDLRPERDHMLVTLEDVISRGDLPEKLRRMLAALSTKMDSPVDIEFAFDGQDLYLLQCRPQSQGNTVRPAPIPRHLKRQDMLFTANRYVSDGLLSNIAYIVYVDGEAYGQLETSEALLSVGVAIGRLNDVLPKRGYILIGPGRWGSRGDIKLGVHVTYSDISGTAALIEVAKESRAYVPELSFGTHFFQDLVESDILYLPLYPDQPGVVFQQGFFSASDNLLVEVLPEYAHLAGVIKLIHVPATRHGQMLSLHMNADLGQAIAFFADPDKAPKAVPSSTNATPGWRADKRTEHWQWRHYMAERIAQEMNMQALGVAGLYLFGSTNTGEAGMGSDIDLLVHFDGDAAQRALLTEWLDGWSVALASINYLRTGYDMERMLDTHIVTDEDIRRGDSYALKIHSITDPAEPLRQREAG